MLFPQFGNEDFMKFTLGVVGQDTTNGKVIADEIAAGHMNCAGNLAQEVAKHFLSGDPIAELGRLQNVVVGVLAHLEMSHGFSHDESQAAAITFLSLLDIAVLAELAERGEDVFGGSL